MNSKLLLCLALVALAFTTQRVLAFDEPYEAITAPFITNTFATTNGVTSTNEIPIHAYTEHFVRHTHNNLNHSLGTNIENSVAVSELSPRDIQDITVAVKKQTRQRVITLGRLTKTEAWVLVAAPAWDTQNHREQPVWTRTLRLSGPNPHFFVIIENISSRPLVLAGWAAEGGILGRLSFELTDSDGKTTLVQPTIPPATVNVPEDQKLDAGQATVVEIDYATTNKRLNFFNHHFPFPQPGHSRKIKMRAVFEEGPFTGSEAKTNYWAGRVVPD